MAEKLAAKLIQKLHKLSRKGLIRWEEGLHDGTFQVNFASYTVSISDRGVDDSSFFVISVFDSHGKLIDAVSDEELDRELDSKQHGSFYKIMGEIYENARRIALGADDAISSILTSLDKIEKESENLSI